MIEIKNSRVKEITLEAGENQVKFDRTYLGFEVKNNSGSDVVMSLISGKVSGDDGVVTIPDGESYNYLHLEHRDTFYLTGSGAVTVAGTSSPGSNFNLGKKGGDGGAGLLTGQINFQGSMTKIHAYGELVEEADTDVPGT